MNAKDFLLEVMKKRNWHGLKDEQAQRAAAWDKTLAKKGKLSYEKSVEWLEKLGYKKVQEEIWEIKK